jgi:hypothetical protein
MSFSGTLSTEVNTVAQYRTLTMSGIIGGNITDLMHHGHADAAEFSTMSLTAVNVYSGKTILTNHAGVGTARLTLNATNNLPTTTTLFISTNSLVNLNFAGIQSVAGLYIAGIQQPSGTYGTNSVSYTNAVYFSGNGILNVGAITPPSNLALQLIPSETNQLFEINQLFK